MEAARVRAEVADAWTSTSSQYLSPMSAFNLILHIPVAFLIGRVVSFARRHGCPHVVSSRASAHTCRVDLVRTTLIAYFRS